MIFGASATHALRALAHLAAAPRGEAMLGRDLAREVAIPAHYLAKVLGTLARAGLLSATRGAKGGYRLARPASEIRLLEIVAPFEGQRARPGCLLNPGEQCGDDRACSAHRAWGGVKDVYLGFLESTTLADIQDGAFQRAPTSPSPSGKPPRHRRTPTPRSKNR